MAKEKTKLVAVRESRYNKLRDLSEQAKIPMVELVSEAVDQYQRGDKK
jgi:hypothetical protein